jgi:hypothetical protein
MKKQRVGIYLAPETIVHNPDYLRVLADQLGLNMVIIYYQGELSREVLAVSPFDGVPPSPENVHAVTCRRRDGQPAALRLDVAMQSVGPHVAAGGDDRMMRQAVQIAKDAGIEVWFMGGAWTARDADVLMYCPSKEQNNRWYEAVFSYLTTAYGIDGMTVTHARYPMVSYPRGLFLCMCDDCTRAATELGYDMDEMKASIQHAWDRLKTIDSGRLIDIAPYAVGPFDYLQALDMRPGIIDWFKFRCDLLAHNLVGFRNAVHAAAGAGFTIGFDTYPASFATLAGHTLSRWGEFSDFASPLLSHVDIFPMRTLVASAEFLLQTLQPRVDEAAALGLMYRFAGYESLDMPTSLADFALGEPDCEYRHMPLRDLVRLDLAKAKLYLPETLPSYPIIQGGGAPHDWPRATIEQLMQDSLALGHDGYIFQGTGVLVDYALK